MAGVSKKFILAHHFKGKPKEENFRLVEEPLPVPATLADGEFLVEMVCLSVDPYMRPYSRRMKEGDLMIGTGVGKIISSKHENFKEGSLVSGPFGWRTHAVSQGQGVTILSDFGDFPSSYGVGALGMPGMTAYFGLLDNCEPRRGETVVVNAAAGAVGSLVGQIAKIKECRVIGFAGTDKKVEYLQSLGFDEAYNYKTIESLSETLKKACPKGIDCFFDNVGGEFFDTVVEQLNDRARVSLCGAISLYNLDTAPPKGPYVHMSAITKELRMEGFLVTRFTAKFPEAIKEMKQWIKERTSRLRVVFP
eukprot:Seg1436.6 transcript_id=Seg1436.6/GoldUCD/mRNA.D3Y31 product="Prostaglandin reductase 1" protein_id=Seg1436.6/GoldUCD/D3Y31